MSLQKLAASAGFRFNHLSSQANENEEVSRAELTYSKDIVSRVKCDKNKGHNLSSIDVLPEYKLVKQLVMEKFPIIFITGGAGTGKSTFVKWMMNEFEGAALLCAPTAIAAINIEGKTIHSLCQLPPAWIVRKDIKLAPRRKEIREAKLLIIDEISMVTSNLLDGVSAFFRLNRKVDQPFGGLPVVIVGDMFQLPPVVNSASHDLYKRIYGSPKFYNAKCLRASTYYAIELKKTFRQTDQKFVNVLTKIREGANLSGSLSYLNTQSIITTKPPEGSVWLSPRNIEVDNRNAYKLSKLPSASMMYRGILKDKFKSDRLPSPMELILKCGAQVMFTKNDPDKRWINGSIGLVERLEDDNIVVRMEYSGNLVDVDRSQWVDYQYKWNSDENEIDREETGSYTQFPLVLAWAITIHKSQGRTIEKVHLDLGNGAFETGQTYVALSRCRTITGLSMARPLRKSDILVDQESAKFYKHLRSVIEKLPPAKMASGLPPFQ